MSLHRLIFPQACARQQNSCEPTRTEGSSVFVHQVSAVLGGMAHSTMHNLVGLDETTGWKVKWITSMFSIKQKLTRQGGEWWQEQITWWLTGENDKCHCSAGQGEATHAVGDCWDGDSVPECDFSALWFLPSDCALGGWPNWLRAGWLSTTFLQKSQKDKHLNFKPSSVSLKFNFFLFFLLSFYTFQWSITYMKWHRHYIHRQYYIDNV